MSTCLDPNLSIMLAKLERRGQFSANAKAAFLRLSCRRRHYQPNRDIVREGEPALACRFLEAGTVSRSKLVPGGGRQIASFHFAGDLVDLSSALLLIADHTLRTHEPCVVLDIDHLQVLRLAEDYPEIGRAFWFDTLVDASIFREWSLNLGRRTARERTAHLLMEIGYRLEDAGLFGKADFTLPMTQADLSDALGMTPVHVNRSLRWLRQTGLINTPSRARVEIPDWDVLADFCAFRPLYLHPEGPRTVPSRPN